MIPCRFEYGKNVQNDAVMNCFFNRQVNGSHLISAVIGGQVQLAPGWTLRDAIETYCRWFKVDRSEVVLSRPFLPQRMLMDDEQY